MSRAVVPCVRRRATSEVPGMHSCLHANQSMVAAMVSAAPGRYEGAVFSQNRKTACFSYPKLTMSSTMNCIGYGSMGSLMVIPAGRFQEKVVLSPPSPGLVQYMCHSSFMVNSTATSMESAGARPGFSVISRAVTSLSLPHCAGKSGAIIRSMVKSFNGNFLTGIG